MIGFDARHNSDVFARDTAEVMTGAGLKALVMPRSMRSISVRDSRSRVSRRWVRSSSMRRLNSSFAFERL